MKQFIFLLTVFLLVLPIVSVAQNTSQLSDGYGSTVERARLQKTYTNFTATSDDTSGYFTVNVPAFASDPLIFPEVRLIGVATDSVAADVYVIGRNGTLTSLTTTYADSIVGTSNTSKIVTITLRAHGTDQLKGCTQFKVGTVFRATGQGTTTGRSLKWYIMYVKP